MDTFKPAVFAIATALASAFGPMPDEPTIIDATIGKESTGAPNIAIEKFLTDSREYLGL